ncbi:MAG: acyl-CoA dehydrogenase family protein, partial [Desulfobacterales bacterium]|nr:acyl-CoA dehydrogenase family protein [Desulfobacterales bacterium]
MNFLPDAGIEAFRKEVREFIAQNLPADVARRIGRGFHTGKKDMQSWMRALHARGWAVPAWPVEYGGTGWSALQRHVFEEELILADAPSRSFFSLNLIGPVIYTFGSAAQKEKYLEPMKTSTFWCQGFSEPESGSDLASLKTRAVRDGDSYVVNGHKIWTTEAHYADWIFALVRTDATERKQRGISFLLIDLLTPGITVRPIRTMDGQPNVNEVFFDNVRVPADNLVGEEGKGWTYAKFLLSNERTVSAEVPSSKRDLARLKVLASAEVAGRRMMDDA